MQLHANAALSLNQRRRMVRRVVEDGWSLTKAAEAAEVSERTCSKWVGRYRAHGEAGLRDRSSAPRSIPHRTAPDRVEVIDLRTARPIDSATILRSVEKTNRLVVVEEGPRTGGWAGEVLATVAEEALGDLDAILRLTTPDHPIPYSPPLEDAFIPGAEAIAQAVRTL